MDQFRTLKASFADDIQPSFEAIRGDKSLIEMSDDTVTGPIFVRFGPSEYVLEIELGVLRRFLDDTQALTERERENTRTRKFDL